MEAGARLSGQGARFTVITLAASLGLAALTLLLPFEPVFDAWSWLIWGREAIDLDLDTSAAASWKPLPVLFTAPFSLAGDAAPDLWLLVARAGWFAAIILAARLGWRLALTAGASDRGGLAAGAIAALGLVLLGDSFTPWFRQLAGGLSEPLLVALLLGAIEAHLVRARWVAFALLTAAALLRPEAWPFTAGYAVWLWQNGGRRVPIALALAALPILWFGPDLIGSGSPLSGAERAADADDEGPLTNGLEALWRAGTLAPAALLAGLVVLLVALRRDPLPPDVPGHAHPPSLGPIPHLAAAAAVWIAIVFAMSLFGFAGLPRFSAPAGALICVLGAVALVLLWERGGGLRLIAAIALVGLAVQGGFRAVGIGEAVGDAVEIHDEVEGMRALVAALGPAPFAACEAVTTSDLDSQPALAWELERHVSEVSLRRASLPAEGVALVGPAAPADVSDAVASLRQPPELARDGWSAYLIACAPARGSAGASAGALEAEVRR